MILIKDDVTLREVKESDLELINKWSNDKELWNSLCGWHLIFTKYDTKNWFINLSKKENYIFYVIEYSDIGAVGTISLSNINWKDRTAYYGIMIGEKNARNKGIATIALNLIEEYSFLELGLNRLESDIISFNKVSLNFHITNGWCLEGEKRNSIFKNGKYHNQMIISKLRSDFIQSGIKNE